MHSGIIVKIRLDPFYQDFLRTYFHQPQDDIVFSFPICRSNEYNFNYLLGYLAGYPPREYTPDDYGKHNFLINMPHMFYRSQERNYISERGAAEFRRTVRTFYLKILSGMLEEGQNIGITKKGIIETFLEKCITKDKGKINRYRKRIEMDVFNQCSKKKLRKKK